VCVCVCVCVCVWNDPNAICASSVRLSGMVFRNRGQLTIYCFYISVSWTNDFQKRKISNWFQTL